MLMRILFPAAPTPIASRTSISLDDTDDDNLPAKGEIDRGEGWVVGLI